MGKRLGLLAGSVDFANAAADEFHDWLDTEHIPERTRLAGILNAVRWLGVANPTTSLVIYDLESLDVLSTPEYLAVSFEHFSPWSKRMLNGGKTKRITRFACEQIWPGDRLAPADAGGLAVFATNAAPEIETEFNRWYDQEQVPAIAEVPGVLCTRRYMSRGGTDHKYVTLVHLESPAVCDGSAWKSVMAAQSARKMDEYMTQRLYMVMRRYVRTT